MGINRVQFQPGLSMSEFIHRYGTEAKCYRALYKWRWPEGFRCPACAGRARSRFRRGDAIYYQCRACRHQTTLTAGTLFEGTKLPLRTWMLAMHLLTSTKTNLAALELMRHLGVNYKTAWRLKHKVMQAMTEREDSRKLQGFVQLDDAYLGGERNGGKPGRGSENKQAFVIAVQTDEHLERPTFAVIEPVRSFDNASLNDWITRRLAPECGSTVTAWLASAGSKTPATPTQRSTPAAAAPPPKWLERDGSTSSWATSSGRSVAPTMPSNKPSMRGATWPKRRTVSTAGSACARRCRDLRPR